MNYAEQLRQVMAAIGDRKPKIPEVLPFFAVYYIVLDQAAWGCLHVVLSDGNHHDDHVLGCIKYARQSGDAFGEELARCLLRMSKTQRGKIPSKVYDVERQARWIASHVNGTMALEGQGLDWHAKEKLVKATVLDLLNASTFA